MKKPGRLDMRLCRGRWTLIAGGLCLAGVAAVPLWAAPPVDPLAAPQFSLDPDSPLVLGGLVSPDDILMPDVPFPAIVTSGADLDLEEMADDIDALSGNVADPGDGTFILLFSVDRATIGAALPDPLLVALQIPYNAADQAARRQAAGDVFASSQLFSFAGGGLKLDPEADNYLCIAQFDEGGTSLVLSPTDMSSDEYSIDPEQDEDDVDGMKEGEGKADGDLRTEDAVYFSLTNGSPTHPGWGDPSGAHIYYNPDPGPGATGIYASCDQLGLVHADEIDAVIVFDVDDNGYFNADDRVLYSLAPGSPSLPGMPGVSPLGAGADIFLALPGRSLELFASASQLGLGAEPDVDNIDALELVLCTDAIECARQHGIRRLLGDCNNNGHIGLLDFFCFVNCISGPDVLLDDDGTITHVVAVGGASEFAPADVIIETGDTVRWTWDDGEHEHNVVSGRYPFPDGNFDSGDPTADPGSFFEVTFGQPFVMSHRMPANVYPYYCEAHPDPDDAGAVVVVPPPCVVCDFEHDGDVDLTDLAAFQPMFGAW